MCINTNWKSLQEVGIPDHLTCLLRNMYAGQEETFKLDMEQKEYVKAVCCHPYLKAYVTFIQGKS